MSYKYPKLKGESHYNRSLSDDVALFVFVPNDSNLDQSIDDFVKLRSERRMHNEEFWLLDVSAWPTVYHAAKAIEESPLNLESDLYLYKIMGEIIALWDHYEIQHTVPRQLLTYGHWNYLEGLTIIDGQKSKWFRRRDMQGAHLRIVSAPWPVMTIMSPINEVGDVYEMAGYFADIWHNLQVIEIITFLCSMYKLEFTAKCR